MRSLKWIIGGLVAAVVLVVGGTWVYLNVIRSEAPAKLTLDAGSTGTTTASAAKTGSTGGSSGTSSAAGSGSTSSAVDGTWKPTSASEAGYRVQEVLFGQNATAVGRTNEVSGQVTISGAKIPSADFTVKLANVKSDSTQRDGQFTGRIMQVSQFPNATFKLTSPIDLGSIPAEGETKTVSATGDLTLHGTTKSVTTDLQVQRGGGQIQVVADIPITFADYGISNPSAGPAQTEDHGELEVKLVLEKS